jgi:hypothetical protein
VAIGKYRLEHVAAKCDSVGHEGETPAGIEGKGVIESFAWETRAGYAIHLLNHTNTNAFKGWIREYYPVGEQRVTMVVPAGRKISRVELLCAGYDVPFKMMDRTIEFTVPSVLDYEIAAMQSG